MKITKFTSLNVDLRESNLCDFSKTQTPGKELAKGKQLEGL